MPSKDPQQRSVVNQRWYKNNHDLIKERRKTHNVDQENKKAYMKKYIWMWHLQKKYGLTVEDYEAMLTAQNDCCAICGVKFDRTHQSTKPCVDHDHETGRVRKILCNNCNSLIGYADEKTEILKKAINYLEGQGGQ